MTQILSIKSTRPTPVVELTPTATTKVAQLIDAEGEPGLALRVAVMFFDAETDAEDIVTEYGPVRVVVDPESAERLRGSTLDYKEGLMGAGFAIENPNVTRSCGCGNSFS
jgi:iron-sulfur cluster assembly accessory protein